MGGERIKGAAFLEYTHRIAKRKPAFKNRKQKGEKRQKKGCRFPFSNMRLRLHPLFIVVGLWYSLQGNLFLFLMSCLVALQHELAHAFAAAKLGYTLNKIVLMPFGAVIDGDLRGISLKDELYVAVCGPLCNLITAGFFVAVWWFKPDLYAFTDTAYYASLSIALVNLLPAYPLDGGRVLYCLLARAFSKTLPQQRAEKIAKSVCKTLSFALSAVLLGSFVTGFLKGTPNFTALTFGCFLFFGSFGNRDKMAVYHKIDFSVKNAFKRGVEIRRVAVLSSCKIKDVFKYFERGTYLVLEVYDEKENKLFEIPQNALSEIFLRARSPYLTLGELHKNPKTGDFQLKNRLKQ